MPANHLAYGREIETVSLLSATTGQLEIAKLPVMGGDDWIIPRSLILSVDSYHDRIWTYIWHKQDVSVYHLFPREQTPTHIVVVESFTDVHRLALQIVGDISYHHVRISDLKDAEDTLTEGTPTDGANKTLTTDARQPVLPESDSLMGEANMPTPMQRNLSPQSMEHNFIFQPVIFQGERCIVPDLDKLSHFLVDLDS